MIFRKGEKVKIICTNIDDTYPNRFVGRIGYVDDMDLTYSYPYCVIIGLERAWSRVERVEEAYEEVVLPKELFEI